MNWAIGFCIVLAIIILAFVLSVFISWLIWPPEKNIPREQFAHWIHALVRYYEDSSSVIIEDKSSSIALIRFYRYETLNKDGCVLRIEILKNNFSIQKGRELVGVIKDKGYEVQSSDWPIVMKLIIEDIWRVSAGNQAERLLHTILDIIGVDREARFSLSVKGSRSKKRTLEARERQKRGLDLGGSGLKK